MNDTLHTPKTSDDLPTVDDYRALSSTAVPAFLAGLASALALAHPLLLVIPLAALVLAAWSLRSIAADKAAGRGLVIAAVCLAVLFLGWSTGARLAYQSLLQRTSRQFADEWLEIVSLGDFQRAHQLHVARENRLDPQTNFSAIHDADPQAADAFREYIESPGFKRLRTAETGFRYDYERCALLNRLKLADEVILEYRVQGAKETFPIWITVHRTFADPYRGPDWEISAVTAEPPFIQ